ncbi:hypothetical protein [Paragemmobacter aquarius]|nr:hypothetical protein [Gemmobacter aquarius]
MSEATYDIIIVGGGSAGDVPSVATGFPTMMPAERIARAMM